MNARIRRMAAASSDVSDLFMATSSSLLTAVWLHALTRQPERRTVIRAVPLSWSFRSLDRRLCVPTFRWVCLCLNRAAAP
jgi:hypothetical protein